MAHPDSKLNRDVRAFCTCVSSRLCHAEGPEQMAPLQSCDPWADAAAQLSHGSTGFSSSTEEQNVDRCWTLTEEVDQTLDVAAAVGACLTKTELLNAAVAAAADDEEFRTSLLRDIAAREVTEDAVLQTEECQTEDGPDEQCGMCLATVERVVGALFDLASAATVIDDIMEFMPLADKLDVYRGFGIDDEALFGVVSPADDLLNDMEVLRWMISADGTHVDLGTSVKGPIDSAALEAPTRTP